MSSPIWLISSKRCKPVTLFTELKAVCLLRQADRRLFSAIYKIHYKYMT